MSRDGGLDQHRRGEGAVVDDGAERIGGEETQPLPRRRAGSTVAEGEVTVAIPGAACRDEIGAQAPAERVEAGRQEDHQNAAVDHKADEADQREFDEVGEQNSRLGRRSQRDRRYQAGMSWSEAERTSKRTPK